MSAPATAIILARAGSRGVPRKNVAPVAGRPCIAWTIDAAQQAETVRRVIVSTDDRDAAAEARRMGAEVVERPADLASDIARVDDAARHAVAVADADADAPPRASDVFVVLYANVPVRPDGLIDRAVSLLRASGADSVQSYAPVGKHHPWWTARLDAGTARVRPWEGEVLNHGVFRRQDLPPALVPDGGVLAMTRRALFLQAPGATEGPHAFFGADRRGVQTREGDVVDIDSPIDLIVADVILRQRHAPAGRGGAR